MPTADSPAADSPAADPPAADPPAAIRFTAVTRAIAARLPFGLHRVVPPTLVGFALINATTFAVDLACLTAARSGLGWPLTLSVTVGYVVAFALGYCLNRVLNFRSHGDLAPQITVYVASVAINYVVWILGLITLLTSVGLDYRLARVAAAACEAAYLYVSLRWLVFRPWRRRNGAEVSRR